MRSSRRSMVADVAPADARPLTQKYRPIELDDVWGQDDVINSIKDLFKRSTGIPPVFLFLGPSGCGKTTLARIVARMLNVDAQSITEVDAATNSSVEAMRELTASLRYAGFGASNGRLLIIDEAHALSKGAWQSLLKTLEEPPQGVHFALCTTEEGKVPETIVTRSAVYRVKPLKRATMFDMLDHVCKREGWDVLHAILQQVVDAADGSPRKALMQLTMVSDCKDVNEAADLLAQPFENKEIIDLCRLLVDRKLTWERAVKTLRDMKDESINPEGVRIVIVNYLQSVLMNAKTDKEAGRLLDILAQFMRPASNPSEKFAPLLLAIGNLVVPQ